MPIGLSDGTVYESDYHHMMGIPMVYDDGPTTDARMAEIDAGKPDIAILKEQESLMELGNSTPQGEDKSPRNSPQNIADTSQSRDVNRLQNYMDDTLHQRVKPYDGIQDPFGTRVEGKDQSRLPKSSGELKFNPAAPEEFQVSKIADKPTPYDDWLKTIPHYDPSKNAGPNNKPHNNFDDGIPSVWDMPEDEYNSTWEKIQRFEGTGKDFLKTLPDTHEAFRWGDDMYMTRKRKKEIPKLEDLVS